MMGKKEWLCFLLGLKMHDKKRCFSRCTRFSQASRSLIGGIDVSLFDETGGCVVAACVVFLVLVACPLKKRSETNHARKVYCMVTVFCNVFRLLKS